MLFVRAHCHFPLKVGLGGKKGGKELLNLESKWGKGNEMTTEHCFGSLVRVPTSAFVPAKKLTWFYFVSTVIKTRGRPMQLRGCGETQHPYLSLLVFKLIPAELVMIVAQPRSNQCNQCGCVASHVPKDLMLVAVHATLPHLTAVRKNKEG